jgi:hypothetical protein
MMAKEKTSIIVSSINQSNVLLKDRRDSPNNPIWRHGWKKIKTMMRRSEATNVIVQCVLPSLDHDPNGSITTTSKKRRIVNPILQKTNAFISNIASIKTTPHRRIIRRHCEIDDSEPTVWKKKTKMPIQHALLLFEQAKNQKNRKQ